MPDNFVISTPATDRFTRLLDRYVQVNTRNAGELVAKKAGDVSFQLYKATADCAPSKAEIAQKVKALGWRVKRKPGAWPLKKGEKRGSAGPLKRMEAAQIGKRSRARGRAASGWIPAANKFGKNPGKRFETFKNPQGGVTIEGIGTTKPKITVFNGTAGIAKLQREKNLTRTAFNAASKDIVTYLRKKQDERLREVKG